MIYPVIVLKTGYGKYTSPSEKIYVSSTSVIFEHFHNRLIYYNLFKKSIMSLSVSIANLRRSR